MWHGSQERSCCCCCCEYSAKGTQESERWWKCDRNNNNTAMVIGIAKRPYSTAQQSKVKLYKKQSSKIETIAADQNGKKSRGEPSAAVTVSFICRCFDIAHIRNSLVPLFYWNSQVQMCLWVIRIEESNARRSWHTHNLLQRIFNFLPKHLLLQTISYLVIGFFCHTVFFALSHFIRLFLPLWMCLIYLCLCI